MIFDTTLAANQQKNSTPILILVYNGWGMLISNLNFLSEQFSNIFIIDNNSEIEMRAEIINMFPNIIYLRLDQNYGWAGGYNRALKEFSFEGHTSVFMLNSDAVANAESVRSAVDGLGERVAAVGSVILEDDGSIVIYDGKFNTNRHPKSLHDVDGSLRPVSSVHGAAFALSLDAYREVGPFHEPYFLYHEEADWCARAIKKGYKIFVSGTSLCYHKGTASSTNENREYYMARNAFLALKRGNNLDAAPNSWLGFVAQGLASPNKDRFLSIAREEGVLDGIFCRFEKRRAHWNPISRNILIAFIRIISIIARIMRKILNN